MPTAPTERLDVQDAHQREIRLRQLLQRINDTTDNSRTASPSASTSNAPFTAPLAAPALPFDFGVRETHPVEPPKELLARLETFLPQMEAANAELARRAEAEPESVNIEHLEDAEGQHIEMNLGLGVFDMRSPSERTGTYSSSSDESSDSSSDDGGSVSQSDSDASSPATSPRRPLIVVLGESSNDSSQSSSDNTDQS